MVSQESLEKYRSGWEHRKERRELELNERREQLREVAQRAASMLYQDYEVDQVLLYGSLARDDVEISMGSDVDLAVEGLSPEKFYKAQGDCLFLETSIEVNLVDFEQANEELRKVIKETGVKLDS